MPVDLHLHQDLPNPATDFLEYEQVDGNFLALKEAIEENQTAVAVLTNLAMIYESAKA